MTGSVRSRAKKTTWWWCGEETDGKCSPAQWRAHHPKECRGSMRKNPQIKRKEMTEEDQESPSQKKMMLSKALSAVAETETNEGTDTDSTDYSSK